MYLWFQNHKIHLDKICSYISGMVKIDGRRKGRLTECFNRTMIPRTKRKPVKISDRFMPF